MPGTQFEAFLIESPLKNKKDFIKIKIYINENQKRFFYCVD
jgi:hypothetical protein